MMADSGFRHSGAIPRVVLCSCGRALAAALRAALESPELEVAYCRPLDSILEEVIRRRPAVVIYELKAARISDLAVLQLLKRAAPDIRLVLIATGSLETERMFRELRPVYYAVHPVGDEEMVEAVHAALGERARRRA